MTPDGFPWLLGLVGYLVPAGVILLAAGTTHPSKSGPTAVWGLLGAAVGLVAYVVLGFGIEFGGLGLVSDFPAADGLRREVPPLVWAGRVVGREWGLLGLGGFVLLDRTLSPDLVALGLHQGAAAATAAAIAAVALSARARLAVVVGVAAATGALFHPLFGNWLWGGGWLGRLGESLALGQGAQDGAGASATFGVGAVVGLAGMLVWEGQTRRGRDPSRPPTAELPLVAVVGALLVAAGWAGQSLIGPPIVAGPSDPAVGIHLLLAASAGALAAALYLGFVRGEVELLLAIRGLLAGLIAVSCGAALYGPLAALGVGAVAGLLLPPATYLAEARMGLQETGGEAGAFLVPSVWGLLAVGLLADGSAGAAGLLTAGTPAGQLAAQLLSIAGLASLGVVIWLGLTLLDRALVWRSR